MTVASAANHRWSSTELPILRRARPNNLGEPRPRNVVDDRHRQLRNGNAEQSSISCSRRGSHAGTPRPWALHRPRKTARRDSRCRIRAQCGANPAHPATPLVIRCRTKEAKPASRALGVCAGSTELDKWTGNPRRSEFREFEDPLTVQKRSKRAAPRRGLLMARVL